MDLSGKQRRHLRALAHHLQPLVQVGHEGLTPGVIHAVDSALGAHELVKVRFGEGSPITPAEGGAALAAELQAHLAQTIGHLALLYRRRKDEPGIQLPR